MEISKKPLMNRNIAAPLKCHRFSCCSSVILCSTGKVDVLLSHNAHLAQCILQRQYNS